MNARDLPSVTPAECVRLIEATAQEVRDCTDELDRRKLERDETARYLRESFAGEGDWLLWLDDGQKETALRRIRQVANYPGSTDTALLRIQATLAGLIEEAAKGHVSRCSANNWPEAKP